MAGGVRRRMLSGLRTPRNRGNRDHLEATLSPATTAAPPSGGSRVVNIAAYQDGVRIATPGSLHEMYQVLRENPHAFAWLGLYRPTADDVTSLADEFDLHELAVEDAIVAHQRPKLERYGDTLFVVTSAARYMDEVEEVEFGELHLFVGPNFVISMRHSESPDLSGVRVRLENDPDLLAVGPEAVLYAILDRVVDEYFPVVAGLENDIDEIETEVFSGDPAVSRRIYELSREVIEFRRATLPLSGMLAALEAGFDKYGVSEELRQLLRDVADHNLIVTERVEGFQQILRDMLTLNATMVAQQQNEEMRALTIASHEQNIEVKKISAWAAILFAPTLIGTIYGMNFTHMPELDWRLGYPFALGLMGAVCITLYVVFKRRDWL
jgi:magnesium transporter